MLSSLVWLSGYHFGQHRCRMDFRVISPERQRSRGIYPLHGHHRITAVSGAVDSYTRDRACLPPEQSFLQMGAGVHSEKPSAHRGECQGMWAQHRQCLPYYMTSILSHIVTFSVSLLPDNFVYLFVCFVSGVFHSPSTAITAFLCVRGPALPPHGWLKL